MEQLGIDVRVTVHDPRGRPLLTVDSPLGREGTESLVLQPAVAGRYGLEVRCEVQGAPEGRYRLRLDALPAADPLRWRAEEALTEAGRLYAENKDAAGEGARAKVEEALAAWRTLGDARREAQAWFLLGKYSETLDAYPQAAEAYEHALALWRQLDDPGSIAAGLAGLGVAHQFLGKSTQAIPYLEEALALRQSLGQRERAAETRNHLCLALQRLGRWPSARECYEQALAMAGELGDRELEARVRNNLGGIAQNLGEPEAALAHFQQALALRRALGDEVGAATTLNNLGALHRTLGEVEEALLHYEPALAIFERLWERYWEARTLNNVGFAYLTVGDLERARSYLLRALAVRREVGDTSGEATTLRSLGLTFSRLEEPGRALAFYRKALERSLEIGDRRGSTTARKLIGALQAAQGEAAAARVELDLALASLREMGNRQEEAEVLELLGRLHLALGDSGAAQEHAARALALQRTVRNPLGEVTALTTRARSERAQGRPVAVRASLEAALAVLESLQGRLGDPNQRATFLASQRAVYELYVDNFMVLHRLEPSRGHDLEALAASERARSWSLLGLLAGSGAGLGPDVTPELRERLRGAERRFTAKRQRQAELLGQEHTPEQALAAEQELYAALTELDTVQAEIRRQSPRHAALDRPPTLDPAGIRALLDTDTVLLEFLLGEERSYLFAVTPATVTSHELPARARIEELAREVHQQVSAVHRRTSATREALDALGQMLLGPVADRLQDQRLVIVADGALHVVPFAALTLPGTHQPVLTRHEVVYLPSASVLAAQRRELARRTPAPKTVAIFADPIFDRDDRRIAATDVESLTRDGPRPTDEALGRLPHTRREAEAIAALVPADQRLVALDGEACRSRVLGADLRAYRILHFATHGFVDARIPELSGLMLSRRDTQGGELNGFLGLYDVSNLELEADLVVLSGCRTALGKEVRGEGLIGLTRGFMYAGVPRVISSLWQVRDQATAELMARFYRGLLSGGRTPAAALRDAQLALWQDRRFRDPFYWAAFGLQGDWH